MLAPHLNNGARLLFLRHTQPAHQPTTTKDKNVKKRKEEKAQRNIDIDIAKTISGNIYIAMKIWKITIGNLG